MLIVLTGKTLEQWSPTFKIPESKCKPRSTAHIIICICFLKYILVIWEQGFIVGFITEMFAN
jgi:hypothetical protein